MKRFFSVLLAVLLAVSCFATISLAAEGATASVSQSQNVKAGDEVTLAVTVSGNFSNYEMTVSAEDKLSITAVTGVTNKVADTKASAKIAFATNDNIATHSFNVTVKVADDATPGTYDVTATPTLAYKAVSNSDDTDGVLDGRVEIAMSSGSATLTIPTPTPTVCQHSSSEWKHDANGHWQICGNCGVKFNEASHDYEKVGEDKPTKCGERGTIYLQCTVCGRENTAQGSMMGHKLESYTKEPTCTEDGYRVPKCTLCGHEMTVEKVILPALGHNFSEEWTTDADYHWHACSRCDAVIAHDDHVWQWVVDKKATATETGRKHEACEICGLTRNVDTVIPKVEGLDDVPQTGDPTPYLALGAVAVLGLLTGAVLVFKRKTAK